MQILSGKLTDKQEFISEVTVLGRALTKTFYLCIARAHNRKNKKNTRLHSSGGLSSIYLVITSSCNLVFFFVFPFVLFERGESLSFIYGIYGRENLFS